MAKFVVLMMCSVLCVACAVRAAEPRPDSAASPQNPGTTPSTPPSTGMAPPHRIPVPVELPAAPQGTAVSTAQMPREVREAVVADAARRFKVESSAVVLTRAEQVTWPNGALGCPEPGRMYTQMLVPGYRVVARTTEGEMTYHTDARGNMVNCAARLPRKATEQVRDGAQPPTTQPKPSPDS